MPPANSQFSILTSLRALSIILVLVSHNPFHPIPFAVVGVDIFFLISGFLITKQILNPNFKVKTFYFNRVRRLLPSLLVVILFTLLFARFFTNITFYNSIKTFSFNSIVLNNNFYQISLANNYFSDYILNPLSSLWSLSIEMQIYLLFPVLILLLSIIKKYLPLKISLTLVTLLVLVSSFMYSGDRYFQTLPRLGDFLIGSLIYLIVTHYPKLKVIKIPSLLFITLMLLYICFQRENVTLYPNISSYLLVIFTSLYILTSYSIHKDNKVTRYFGERSYAIYLSYLPITIFTSLNYSPQKSYIIVVALILISAELLYRLDNLFRNKLKSPKRVLPWLTLLLILNLVLVFLPGGKVSNNLSVSKNLGQVKENLDYALTKGFPKKALDYYQSFNSDPMVFTTENANTNQCNELKICQIPATLKHEKTILYVADSTAREFLLPLSENAEEKQQNFIYYNLSSCEITGIDFDDMPNYSNQSCKNFSSSLTQYIKTLNIDPNNLIVVLQQASDPTRVYNNKYIQNQARNTSFEQLLKKLIPLSDKISVISEIPYPSPLAVNGKVAENFALDCLSRAANTLTCAFDKAINPTSKLILLNKASAEKLGVKYLDLSPYLCSENKCPVFVNNMLTYTDPLHISYQYIYSIKEILMKELSLA